MFDQSSSWKSLRTPYADRIVESTFQACQFKEHQEIPDMLGAADLESQISESHSDPLLSYDDSLWVTVVGLPGKYGLFVVKALGSFGPIQAIALPKESEANYLHLQFLTPIARQHALQIAKSKFFLIGGSICILTVVSCTNVTFATEHRWGISRMESAFTYTKSSKLPDRVNWIYYCRWMYRLIMVSFFIVACTIRNWVFLLIDHAKKYEVPGITWESFKDHVTAKKNRFRYKIDHMSGSCTSYMKNFMREVAGIVLVSSAQIKLNSIENFIRIKNRGMSVKDKLPTISLGALKNCSRFLVEYFTSRKSFISKVRIRGLLVHLSHYALATISKIKADRIFAAFISTNKLISQSYLQCFNVRGAVFTSFTNMKFRIFDMSTRIKNYSFVSKISAFSDSSATCMKNYMIGFRGFVYTSMLRLKYTLYEFDLIKIKLPLSTNKLTSELSSVHKACMQFIQGIFFSVTHLAFTANVKASVRKMSPINLIRSKLCSIKLIFFKKIRSTVLGSRDLFSVVYHNWREDKRKLTSLSRYMDGAFQNNLFSLKFFCR